MVLAMSMISSRGIDFECLMFFSFFRSRGGSFRALMTREDAEGTTETAACRFWIVSLTVTRRPFYLMSTESQTGNKFVNAPSRLSLSRYLHRPSSGTDREDRFWERELQRIRPHRQWREGGCQVVSLSVGWEDAACNLHDLNLTGVDLGSCRKHMLAAELMLLKKTILTHGECGRWSVFLEGLGCLANPKSSSSSREIGFKSNLSDAKLCGRL